MKNGAGRAKGKTAVEMIKNMEREVDRHLKEVELKKDLSVEVYNKYLWASTHMEGKDPGLKD